MRVTGSKSMGGGGGGGKYPHTQMQYAARVPSYGFRPYFMLPTMYAG